ncbi:MAG: sulfatase family protein [Myxococcota bacterium]
MRRLALGLLLVLPCVAAPVDAADDTPRWNLLLLMAEDLSPRLGAYGDPVAHTPNLDRLAREGTRYTRAFTSAGVCAPSRAAILMGVHQNHWGAGHMRASAGGYVAVPPPDWKAFPELLRRAGYHVVNNGKTDYQMSTTLGGVFGGPASIWDEERGEDWRGRDAGQPFFAYLTFEATHESQVWPTWDLSSMSKLMLAPWRVWNHWQWEHRTDPARVAVPPYYPDTPTVRADLARHYDNVAVMDAQVGAVLRRLEEDGLADRTVVVFTTDHGDGLPRAKRWLYDSGVHVPLLVRWPGVAAPASVDDSLVSGVDLAPTLLAAAGAPVPAHMEGRVFAGPDAEPAPEFVFAARDRIDDVQDRVRAVRDARFKYVRHLEPSRPYVQANGFRDQMPMMQELHALAAEGRLGEVPALWFRPRRDPEELFDTQADPHEVRNLAGDPDHAATLARLRAVLDTRLASGRDLGLLPEAELARRFWPDGEQPVTAAPEGALRGGALHLSSATAGASIVWRAPSDDRWRLYVGPLRGVARVEAKAVRYGWRESGGVSLP